MSRRMKMMSCGLSLLAAMSSAVTADAKPGLDPSFGDAGSLLMSAGGSDDQAYALALLPDGRIAVTGVGWPGTMSRLIVLVVGPNGVPDPGFGSSGWVSTSAGTTSSGGWGIAVQPDGKLVVGGYAFNDHGSEFVLARYLLTGALDPTFGDAGLATGPERAGDDGARALALLPDGKIALAGYVSQQTSSGVAGSVLATARFTNTGHVDTSFGDQGWVLRDPSNDLAELRALTFDDSQKRLLGTGFAHFNHSDRAEMVILGSKLDGTPDASFGGNGLVTTAFTGFPFAQAETVHIDAKGRILVGGWKGVDHKTRDFALTRYDHKGKLDSSFGGDGRVVSDFGSSAETVIGIAEDSSGRVLAIGSVDGSYAIARYEENGTLDATFADKGILRLDTCTGAAQARAAKVQPDGKLLIAGGCFTTPFNATLLLTRVTGLDLKGAPTGNGGAGGGNAGGASGSTSSGGTSAGGAGGTGGTVGTPPGQSGSPNLGSPASGDSSSGCACRTTNAPNRGAAVWLAAAALALMGRRRRTSGSALRGPAL